MTSSGCSETIIGSASPEALARARSTAAISRLLDMVAPVMMSTAVELSAIIRSGRTSQTFSSLNCSSAWVAPMILMSSMPFTSTVTFTVITPCRSSKDSRYTFGT